MLNLPDHSDRNSSFYIDMLIGSDYYRDLVTGNVCRSDEGFTAVNIKLGWVLRGPVPAEDA